MKFLFVGDPHYRPEDLSDCKKLIDQIEQLVLEKNIDKVVYLGDLHHTFSIVRIEAISFWREALSRIKVPQILLVGNHDMSENTSNHVEHALLAYKDMPNVTIVDKPLVEDDICFLPYIHGDKNFEKIAQEHPAKILVCHQTISGAIFANGFAPDGADRAVIPHPLLISGHIHRRSLTSDKGKITWYVGSPRWMDVNDANEDKMLLFADIQNGEVVISEFVQSNCKKILKFTVDENNVSDEMFNVSDQDRVIYDVHGTQKFIKEVQDKLAKKDVRIRTFLTEKRGAQIKESVGIKQALTDFVQTFVPPNGSSPQDVLNEIKTKLRFQ
jgi:DNA repair exonuclease SbcCD nuclease subunit